MGMFNNDGLSWHSNSRIYTSEEKKMIKERAKSLGRSMWSIREEIARKVFIDLEDQNT